MRQYEHITILADCYLHESNNFWSPLFIIHQKCENIAFRIGF